jgi:REP element-mobilizing transposase RayT
LIQEGIERFGHRIHGFCFMGNHIHLVFQAGPSPISGAMHHLSFRYTQYINRNQDRKGHLFQGRFKAILIDDNEYLTELIRYVHLNPVRAGIVKKPEDYFWSGHRVYLDLEVLPWLSQDWILSRFETEKALAKKRYQRFLQLGIGRKHHYDDFFESGSKEGRILGSSDFVENILNEAHQLPQPEPSYSLDELINVVCDVLGESRETITSLSKGQDVTRIRAITAFFVKRAPHLILREFARRTGRDASALSKLVRATEQKIRQNKDFALLIDTIQKRLGSLRTARTQA